MRRLRMRIPPREVAGLLAVVVVGALIGVMGYVVVDAARAREQATRQLEAQAEQAIDTRIAQTARINRLSEQVASLQAEVTAQEGTIAAQSQAIADLSAQLRRAGSDPITGDPAADAPPSTGGSDLEFPTPAPSPTPAPRRPADPAAEPAQPNPAPGPAPEPAPDPAPDEPLCLPLDLLCIGG